MANPMYGQNKADADIDIFGRGKINIITVAAGVHHTLSADDTGSVVMIAPNSTEVTLPSVASGLNFKFVLSGDYSTAVCLVNQDAATSEFVGAMYGTTQGENAATDSDVAEADGSNTKITFSSASLKGDFVNVYSDGTSWYCEAWAQNTAAITWDD